MSKYYYCAITLLLAFFITTGYVLQAQPDSLSSGISALISKYKLEKSTIAIKIITLSAKGETSPSGAPGNKTVYERNSDTRMVIASNTKLFSTAAALCKLGPDFQFTSSISYDGVITNSALNGNLVVWSNGDPNISGRFYKNNPTAVFEQWADQLIKSGINKISGNLIIDQSAFDRECLPPGWPEDQLSYWYCAPISAVSFNDNCVDITVWSDAKSGRMRYALSPPTKYVDVSFDVSLNKKLSASQLKFSRQPGTNRINISGRASPKDIPTKESITVDNPGLFFGTVLKETLARKGIAISGNILTIDNPYKPSGKPVKIAATSTDLVQTINVVNRRSQNFYAEQILKTMAYNSQGKGTRAGGLKIISEFLTKELGFAKDGFTISDASGLARQNLFSVSQLTGLLRYMYSHKHFTTFRDSLNYERWNFSNSESVWTKTGYIRNALALSGYIRRGQDDYYAFSCIINDFDDTSDINDNPGLENAENFRSEFIKLLQK